MCCSVIVHRHLVKGLFRDFFKPGHMLLEISKQIHLTRNEFMLQFLVRVIAFSKLCFINRVWRDKQVNKEKLEKKV